jgi:hypothetical protein
MASRTDTTKKERAHIVQTLVQFSVEEVKVMLKSDFGPTQDKDSAYTSLYVKSLNQATTQISIRLSIHRIP